MSEWQDISTAPMDENVTALVFDGHEISLATREAGDCHWWVLWEYTVRPTHWMPLPAPPSPEKHTGE